MKEYIQSRIKTQDYHTRWALANLLVDPILYITIALFAGEASPHFFPFNSGWMYIFGFLAVIALLLSRRKLILRKDANIVFLIYVIIIVRNISINNEVIFSYELPNIGTLMLLIILGLAFYKREDTDSMMDYLFIYASILAMLGVFRFVRNPSGRLAVFGGPNGYYKIALLFEVLCFYRYLERKKNYYLIGVITGLVLCLATGSRGGIVSMAIILFLEIVFYIFNAGEKRKLIIKRLFQITAISFVGFFFITAIIKHIPALGRLVDRATSFIFADNISSFTSVSARNRLIEIGIQAFKESPLVGKGAKYTYFYTAGTQPYSHNIFVEFLSEQGLLGFIPLLLFFIGVFYKVLRYGLKDNKLFALFLCLCVYFSGSLFSGNILDSKVIFVFGVLIFSTVRNIVDERRIKGD